MAATEHERRRFVTRADVEDAAAAGRPVVLGARDVLTDEAAQRATDLGVRVERSGSRSAGGPAGGSAGAVGVGGPASGADAAGSGSSEEELRRAVRAAVVAELGREPAGLDAAIDRVLSRRR